MNKCKKVIAAAVLSLGVSAPVWSSDVVQFDYNGAAAGGVLSDVLSFDWSFGNALAIGGNPAGGVQIGTTNTLIYQAALGLIKDSNNQAVFANGLTDPNHRFAVVSGFGEVATAAGPNASFAFDPTNPVNFFKIYANGGTIANDLAGSGFASGSVILSGTVTGVSFTSNFTADGTVGQFDQVGVDNYGGKLSISGAGGTRLVVQVNSVDTDYFLDGVGPGGILSLEFQTDQKTPFNVANPSQCFVNNTGTADCQIIPNLATINGFNVNEGLKDFQLQVDGGNSFLRSPQLPEPASLALLAAGLLGLSVTSRKKSPRS